MANSILSSALGQVGDLGKQAIKEVVKQPKQMAKGALSQAGFERPEDPEGKEKAVPKVDRSKDTEEFVKGLYGADQEVRKETKETKGTEETQVVQNSEPVDSNKSPEEQAKLQQLRSKLHQETYYQPLITRPKKQEEVEKPKERVERIEMEDLQKKEEEKKKKANQDISLEREKTKIEKRPGAG